MAIFQSTRPHNIDPTPFVVEPAGNRATPEAAAALQNEPDTTVNYAPRAEYNQRRPYAANPILLALRRNTKGLSGVVFETEVDLWLAAVAGEDEDSYAAEDRAVVEAATPEQADHAGRVLTKLAAA